MTDTAFLSDAYQKMLGYLPVAQLDPDFRPTLAAAMREELPEGLRRAWALCVYEAEKNFKPSPYGGDYFTAGGRGGWQGMVFGQDPVGAGLLALNRLYPDLMRSQLRTYVLARLNIGLMGVNGWQLENVDGAVHADVDAWVPESREFIKRFSISPALNRTGEDVGWLWTAGDLFDLQGDLLDWAWLYQMGELFFSHFYQPFFDDKDGLYFGQASFIDVGGSGYPLSFGGATQAGRNAAVWIKASSTNALYARDMDVMAHAARLLGLPAKADAWKKRAQALRTAMRDRLRFADGTFAYFMRRDGTLEGRVEALGAAYAVLAEVVTGEDAVRALALDRLPRSDAGVPCFFPFYADNPKVYHNHAAWPFVSTFYYWACEKATGKSAMREDARQLAQSITVPAGPLKLNEKGCLADYQTGTFKEIIRWADQTPDGVSAQMWTLGAFMNLCLRQNWLTIPYQHSRFL